ncbi:hypothetical protein THERMOT_984 [Bathymodiolus thermophilus thioautotrophic gill symbiont]|nr:hypothetical protein THERMOT_984 [Bathymodiolus thermophilus thioautotrophic gill symbiont]
MYFQAGLGNEGGNNILFLIVLFKDTSKNSNTMRPLHKYE